MKQAASEKPEMECREFKNLVRPFLDGKLDSLKLDSFTCHLIECKSCETDLLAIPEASGT